MCHLLTGFWRKGDGVGGGFQIATTTHPWKVGLTQLNLSTESESQRQSLVCI